MRVGLNRASRRELAQLPLVALSCAALQLLLFVGWMQGRQVAEYLLPAGPSPASELRSRPPPQPASELDFDPVVIHLSWRDGGAAWQINGVPMPSRAVARAHLAALSRVKPDAPLVVEPDDDVLLDDVIASYDECRNCGLRNVRLAVPGFSG